MIFRDLHYPFYSRRKDTGTGIGISGFWQLLGSAISCGISGALFDHPGPPDREVNPALLKDDRCENASKE